MATTHDSGRPRAVRVVLAFGGALLGSVVGHVAWLIVVTAGYREVFGWADRTAFFAAAVGFIVAWGLPGRFGSPTRVAVAALAFGFGVSAGVALTFYVPGLPDMVATPDDVFGWLLFVLAMIGFTFLPALLLGATWAALLALLAAGVARGRQAAA